jgi:hypothetical protein
MEKFIIDISSDKKVATVTISLKLQKDNIKKEKYTTKDVIDLLEKENYEVSDVVQASMVTNSNENKLNGTWIFLLSNTNQVLRVESPPAILTGESSAPVSEAEAQEDMEAEENALECEDIRLLAEKTKKKGKTVKKIET